MSSMLMSNNQDNDNPGVLSFRNSIISTLQQPEQPIKPDILPSRSKISIESNHAVLLDFLRECRESGFVVIIARMDNSDILYVNDLIPENRVLCKPLEMLDKGRFDNNYLWRDTMGDKSQMEELLMRDGFIPQYEHRIRRLDNSMCRYAHNFHLVNWLGCLSRLVVSRPGDFEIIEFPQ